MAVSIKFEIGHIAKLNYMWTPDGFIHMWDLYVRGSNDSDMSAYLSKVSFMNLLEPGSEAELEFEVVESVFTEPPYCIRLSGYASEKIVIYLHFRNWDEPRRVKYIYELDIQEQRSEEIKLLIENPSEEFRQKLIKGGGIPVMPITGPTAYSSGSPNILPRSDSDLGIESMMQPEESGVGDGSSSSTSSISSAEIKLLFENPSQELRQKLIKEDGIPVMPIIGPTAYSSGSPNMLPGTVSGLECASMMQPEESGVCDGSSSSTSSISSAEIKLLFENPLEEFRQKLIKKDGIPVMPIIGPTAYSSGSPNMLPGTVSDLECASMMQPEESGVGDGSSSSTSSISSAEIKLLFENPSEEFRQKLIKGDGLPVMPIIGPTAYSSGSPNMLPGTVSDLNCASMMQPEESGACDDSSSSTSSISSAEIKLLFENPSEEFRQKLIKGDGIPVMPIIGPTAYSSGSPNMLPGTVSDLNCASMMQPEESGACDDSSSSTSSISSAEIKLLFENPSEEFRQKLIKGDGIPVMPIIGPTAYSSVSPNMLPGTVSDLNCASMMQPEESGACDDSSSSTSSISSAEIKLLFENPSEEFRQKLIKGDGIPVMPIIGPTAYSSGSPNMLPGSVSDLMQPEESGACGRSRSSSTSSSSSADIKLLIENPAEEFRQKQIKGDGIEVIPIMGPIAYPNMLPRSVSDLECASLMQPEESEASGSSSSSCIEVFNTYVKTFETPASKNPWELLKTTDSSRSVISVSSNNIDEENFKKIISSSRSGNTESSKDKSERMERPESPLNISPSTSKKSTTSQLIESGKSRDKPKKHKSRNKERERERSRNEQSKGSGSGRSSPTKSAMICSNTNEKHDNQYNLGTKSAVLNDNQSTDKQLTVNTNTVMPSTEAADSKSHKHKKKHSKKSKQRENENPAEASGSGKSGLELKKAETLTILTDNVASTSKVQYKDMSTNQPSVARVNSNAEITGKENEMPQSISYGENSSSNVEKEKNFNEFFEKSENTELTIKKPKKDKKKRRHNMTTSTSETTVYVEPPKKYSKAAIGITEAETMHQNLEILRSAPTTSAVNNITNPANNSNNLAQQHTTTMQLPVSIPLDNSDAFDLAKLQILQQRIMHLEDPDGIQEVTDIIAASGRYQISQGTFDFNLSQLDRSTIERLQEFFARFLSGSQTL